LSVLNSQDLVLTVTPSGVPEPSTWAMVLGGVAAVFHRPHPAPTTKKGAVEAVRQFLTNAGVQP